MRYAAKNDKNATELVEFARQMGALVVWIRQPVDILVGIGGKWFPVELKSDDGRFTKQQKDFMVECGPHGLPVWVWYSVRDVQRDLGGIKPEALR